MGGSDPGCYPRPHSCVGRSLSSGLGHCDPCLALRHILPFLVVGAVRRTTPRMVKDKGIPGTFMTTLINETFTSLRYGQHTWLYWWSSDVGNSATGPLIALGVLDFGPMKLTSYHYTPSSTPMARSDVEPTLDVPRGRCGGGRSRGPRRGRSVLPLSWPPQTESARARTASIGSEAVSGLSPTGKGQPREGRARGTKRRDKECPLRRVAKCQKGPHPMWAAPSTGFEP